MNRTNNFHLSVLAVVDGHLSRHARYRTRGF